MKYITIASVLPLLAAASPENVAYFEKRTPEPQLQFLPLIAAGQAITLGALGTAALGAGALASGALGGERDCSCGRNFQGPACSGTLCECQNTANIACWANQQGKCKVSLKVCPAGNGQNGSPTALNSPYPPCGQALPACGGGSVCHKLDTTCRDGRSGGCIGLCIPQFPGSASKGSADTWWSKGNTPAKSTPQWGASGPQTPPNTSPGPARCPASYSCSGDQVCVVDPHNTQQSTRGPAYKCVVPTLCGGFNSQQCASGQLCVPDPRMACTGQGCTGVCA